VRAIHEWGDAASKVNTSGCQHLERKIADFIAVTLPVHGNIGYHHDSIDTP
jgi:hypothetical protein